MKITSTKLLAAGVLAIIPHLLIPAPATRIAGMKVN